MPAGLLGHMACAVLWLHHSSSLVSTACKTKLVELACCNTFALVRLTFLRWFRCPWSHSSSRPPAAVAVAAVVMLLCTQAGNLWLRRRVIELMPIKLKYVKLFLLDHGRCSQAVSHLMCVRQGRFKSTGALSLGTAYASSQIEPCESKSAAFRTAAV